MNIAVIAANGRLGQKFVEEALAKGHSVRAGVRGDNHLVPHEKLTVVPCDATNSDEVANLLAGQDIVVSCIGHVKGSAADVQTSATKVIVQVMNNLGLKRFVTVTGTGVRFPGDKISLVDRVLNVAVSAIDPDRVNDGLEHTKVLQASGLDWTLIRVLKLQNVSSSPFLLTLNGPTKWYVGRKEVAKAMLEVIEHSTFVKQAPIISVNKKGSSAGRNSLS